MKKVSRIAALALICMSLTVACKQKPAETIQEDTTPACCEQVMDTVDSVENVAEEPVVEEPVKKATTTTKKKEQTPTAKNKAEEKNLGSTLPASGGSARSTQAPKAEEKKVSNTLPASGGAARARK